LRIPKKPNTGTNLRNLLKLYVSLAITTLWQDVEAVGERGVGLSSIRLYICNPPLQEPHRSGERVLPATSSMESTKVTSDSQNRSGTCSAS